MLRNRALLILALFLTLAVLASSAYADSQARIVRLSYVGGDVQLAHQGSGFENATLNVPIIQGDQLRAGSDGWAEIEFEDGSTIRMAPGSAITLSELRLLTSGGTVTSVDLDQGEAEFKITRHDEGEFQVTARNKTIVLKHSSRFRVTSLNSDPLEVVVWSGEVGVQDRNAGQEVSVKKKETFAQDLLDPARYDLEKGVEADGLDQWSSQRDEYRSAYAKTNAAASPYQYGVSDLNYYGQYYNVPGYGNMWQPYGVNIGWDPFANGYWSFTPGGYVWVSAYPWGWMPYRYGHWEFVNGYGWLWQPGSWHTWNYCPPVRNAPPGFRPPTPPAPGTIGTTVSGGGGGTPPRTIRPSKIGPHDEPGPPATGTIGTTVSGGGDGTAPRAIRPGKIGPHDEPGPVDGTGGARGSRTFIQPEPPTSGVAGSNAGNLGNQHGNPGTPGQGTRGDHTAVFHNTPTGVDTEDRQVMRNEHARPGTPEGGVSVLNTQHPTGVQQHTPPQPPVQTSAPPPQPPVHVSPPPPQPVRMPPVTPAPPVHPAGIMSSPPAHQYSPPPAPAPVMHSAPMQSSPPSMVHSAPSPAQAAAPGKPR